MMKRLKAILYYLNVFKSFCYQRDSLKLMQNRLDESYRSFKIVDDFSYITLSVPSPIGGLLSSWLCKLSKLLPETMIYKKKKI